MMTLLKKNLKKVIFLLILLCISIVFFLISISDTEAKDIKKDDDIKIEKKKVTKKESKKEIIYFIDVKGEVNDPKVIKIDSNLRVIDAINMAGGFKEDADTSILNLSKKLKDESVIYVYSKKETEEYHNKLLESEKINEELEKKIICPDKENLACINNKKVDTEEKEKDNKVDINNASKEELLTITGVGESKALAIIDYREKNGGFKSIEDIKNVSGIGDALFEKIKDFISV